MEAWNQPCYPEEIQQFEKKYNLEFDSGKVSGNTKFQYACLLVRSGYAGDIRKGITLLEDMYNSPRETGKRDYVYFLAVGHARLKNFNEALKYIDGLLKIEPANRQARDLRGYVQKEKSDEQTSATIAAGGAVLAVGALVGLGMALFRK